MSVLKLKIAIVASMTLGLAILASCTKKSPANDILHVDQNASFPKGFPPDPGDAGKRTLEGIDSDHDGLRDDVQRWIYARYPNDDKKRKALRQSALSYQSSLNPNLKDSDLSGILLQSDKALTCLTQVFQNSPTEAVIEHEYVQAKMLNTKERTEQFLKLDARFDGKTLGPSSPNDGTACDK